MESEGVEDAQRNENDASERCKIEIMTESESGKDWDEIQSDYKLINDLIVCDGIEIKSEDPMISYGEINDDVTENGEKKRDRTDFGLTQVKNGTLKRAVKKTYYGSSNCRFRKIRSVRLRMKRLRNIRKRQSKMNQPSTSNGVVLEQYKVDIKTENESDKNYEGIETQKLEATSVLSGELESVECKGPSVVKDDQCTANDSSAEQNTDAQMQKRLNPLINTLTEQRDKLCEQSDFKLINDLIVSDAIEIKDEFIEEIPIINFGEICTDVAENKDRKSEITEFGLTKVKTGALKVRPKQRKTKRKRSVRLRMKLLRNMRKMNQPSTSKGVVLEDCEDEIKSEPKPDINSDEKHQEDVAELSFEFIDCKESIELMDSPLTENDENTLPVAPYKCEPCNKSYATKKSLAQHVRQHNNPRDYKCKVCGKQLSGHRSLKEHMMMHRDERPFQCDVCNKTFRTKENVKVHLRSHSKEKPFECETCNKKYSQRSHLVRHAGTHSGEKPFQCDEKFTARVGLVRHKLLHSGDKPFKCDLCSKTFTQHGNYVKHSRIHTGEKPYKCQFCSKSFGLKGSLKIHVRMHTGERPHECNFCDKKFSEKSTLTKHIRMHTGEMPYKCGVCDRPFARRQGLVLHLRTQHDNQQNS